MTDPFAPFWIAQINRHTPDPAVDIIALPLDEYSESRDESLLTAKPGATLAMLEVQKLGWKIVAGLDRYPVGSSRWLFAFQCAVHRVRVGSEILEAKCVREPINGILMAPDAWMDQIAAHPRFGPYAILEAGQVACEFAMLKPEQRRSFTFPAG